VRSCISAIAICVAACLQLQGAPATLAEFPFQFREGLLWVEGTTPESAKPLNFLLDTGAEVSVINLSTAKRLGLSLAPKVKVRGVHASMTGYWPQTLSATASGIALPADFLAVGLSKVSRSQSALVESSASRPVPMPASR